MSALNAKQHTGYELQLAHFAAEMVSLPKAGSNSHDRLSPARRLLRANGT
jgi:hypothetical protein